MTVTVAEAVVVDEAPVAVADVASVDNLGTVLIDVAANDTDELEVDGSTIVIVTGPGSGTATVTAGQVTYEHTGVETEAFEDSFTYTISDTAGQVSDEAVVTVAVAEAVVEDEVPVAVADVASVENLGTVLIDVAANDTDELEVDGSTIVIVTGPESGTAAVTAGQVAYEHTGVETEAFEDSFTYTISDAAGQVSDEALVTVTVVEAVVVDEAPVAVADVASVENQGTVVIDVAANDTDELEVDGSTIVIVTGPGSGTATVIGGQVTYEHTGAETEAFDDNFTYTISDVAGQVSEEAVVTVTVASAELIDEAPVTVDDDESIEYGESVNIAVLENDTDDSAIDITTVEIATEPTFGVAIVNEINGAITYEHDGSNDLLDNFSYTVRDDAGQISQVATVTVTVAEPPLPSNGLVLHLEADAGVTVNAGEVVAWEGMTINLNNLGIASGFGGPTLEVNSLNSLPVVYFDGVNDLLVNDTSIDSLPLNNEDRTVFMLLNTDGGTAIQYGEAVDNGAVSFAADAVSGNAVFGTYGDENISSFGLSGQGWQVQSITIGSNQWRHYLNDVVVDSGTGSFATGSEFLAIGGSIDGGDLADSSIAALLVYDAELSASEHQGVLDYLRVKYAIEF